MISNKNLNNEGDEEYNICEYCEQLYLADEGYCQPCCDKKFNQHEKLEIKLLNYDNAETGKRNEKKINLLWGSNPKPFDSVEIEGDLIKQLKTIKHSFQYFMSDNTLMVARTSHIGGLLMEVWFYDNQSKSYIVEIEHNL